MTTILIPALIIAIAILVLCVAGELPIKEITTVLIVDYTAIILVTCVIWVAVIFVRAI